MVPNPSDRTDATVGPDEICYDAFDALDQGFCTIEVLFDDGASAGATDYRFLRVNGAFEQQTGLNAAIGHRMRDLAPAHEDHWFEIYGRIATTGTPERFERQAAALNRWFEVYAFRVGEPNLHHVAVLFRDITDRKYADAALQTARREADRSNRAKDQFVVMLAHELRTPLAPMLTALQVLRLRGIHMREHDILERQVANINRMVDDLTDVSRVSRGIVELRRQPIELCQIVLSSIELAGPSLERHFVDVQIPPAGFAVNVDRARMAQVFANLLTNAAKYSDGGSRIRVTVERDAGVVRAIVNDEGIGLAADELEQVFEPFVQQPQGRERAAGGLGLGLAIVRSLVVAHGGTVHAQSGGANQGCKFVVELPTVSDSSPSPS
jgi:signal transduction histidine kinase